ncbi:C-type lectin domain family 10 member A isoform X4 [Xenopus tropicalis]|uniref:C-type lectin domain family 10 member A isoform X4 n=3 Tax=Xenopus tropicalis TaxID=8364 RepID=A0A8J0SK15_XENTR|nr:C-type lectin domain family 10 member A isoform X4 [Xenopus tropicalis]|eukprot:XP_012815689.1 PREDICTED: C-type lectin domain family 10 member A isoform X4 [Xenopus tropicalis]
MWKDFPWIMSKEYQDLQCLQEEETSAKSTGPAMKAFKMQSWVPSNSSRPLYGFCCLFAVLLVVIVILIVHFQKPEIKDRSLEYQLGNFSVSVKSHVSQLTQDGTRLMDKITELETSVKKIQNELSLGSLQSDMQRVLGTLGRLVDRVQTLQVNGSQEPLCPDNWHRFTLSCYYVSKSGYPWEEAKKRCEGLSAHLVVINNEDEQEYVFGIAKGQFTWIGLTDSEGEWKWLDGTPYNTSPKFWIADQPDNYFGHGLGGGEDCAHLHYNGQWNDDHCSRRYRFICEKAI